MPIRSAQTEAFEAAVLGPSLVDPNSDGEAEPRYTDSLAPTIEGGAATWQLAAKRALDILAALVLLLLVLPVLLVGAIGVRLSSEGPILFRQERVGRGGRHFSMLKLRSFPVDHVDRTHSLPVAACPLRWGRFLRRTSLDELPQLLNVLKGDMSLVGPRPERPRFAEEVARRLPAYRERHRMPAGLTGLAQVRGLSGPTSIEARIAADNEYIDGWHVGRDVAILLRTIPTVIRKAR